MIKILNLDLCSYGQLLFLFLLENLLCHYQEKRCKKGEGVDLVWFIRNMQNINISLSGMVKIFSFGIPKGKILFFQVPIEKIVFLHNIYLSYIFLYLPALLYKQILQLPVCWPVYWHPNLTIPEYGPVYWYSNLTITWLLACLLTS